MNKFIEDLNDLNSLKKCPNDYPFWYFLLLHFVLLSPLYVAAILGFIMGVKYD